MGALEFDDLPLAWSDVAARFAAEPYWWVGTSGDAGPHAVPIWGVVVDDVLHFYGEPDTLRSRQLAADGRLVVHLPDPLDVLTVKGTAITGTPARDHRQVCEAYRQKYAGPDERRWLPDEPGMEESLLFTVAPRRAIAFQPAAGSVWRKRVWVATEARSAQPDPSLPT